MATKPNNRTIATSTNQNLVGIAADLKRNREEREQINSRIVAELFKDSNAETRTLLGLLYTHTKSNLAREVGAVRFSNLMMVDMHKVATISTLDRLSGLGILTYKHETGDLLIKLTESGMRIGSHFNQLNLGETSLASEKLRR